MEILSPRRRRKAQKAQKVNETENFKGLEISKGILKPFPKAT